MANELQPLSLLFQNRLFRIPDYQRGYAWLQQQLGVSEYLYRLRELSLMYDGKIPLMVQERANWPKKIGRNDPCPCGSGKKYKFCHGKN